MRVLKCQHCMDQDSSLQSIAAQYRTDFLSLYTTNIHLVSPDRVPLWTPINVGVLYTVKEGDSMAYLATRFFTTIEKLLEVNADISTRSSILTPFSRGANLTVVEHHLWSPDMLTSDNLPMNVSSFHTPSTRR